MAPDHKNEDENLKIIVVGVASFALVVSLLATIFGRDAQFREVALLFSAVSAFVFGAHIFTRP